MTQSGRQPFDDSALSGPMAEVVRRVSMAGFASLWHGRPLSVAELVDGDGGPPAAAVEHLRRQGRIELSDDGLVVAVHGLCRRPTAHRIEHDRGVINTWCAFDVIGIPAALAIDARATTLCPTCRAALSVKLAAGEPEPLPGAVLWYPEVSGGHLVNDFCSGANLFCSAAHLERWADARPASGSVLTIAEVAELGRAGWADAAHHLRTGWPAGDPWPPMSC